MLVDGLWWSRGGARVFGTVLGAACAAAWAGGGDAASAPKGPISNDAPSTPAGAGGIEFVEEGAQRGLNYLVGTPYAQFGAGLALVDLNNSGRLDVVVLGAANGLVGIYENIGSGQFVNRSFGAGIGPMSASGVSAADYDGDGYLDLYIGGWLTPSRLLRNNGNFTFTDVTDQAGLTMTAPAMASAWGDVDGDGWLDLYVTTRTGTNANFTRNKFYKNMGDGTFVEMAGPMGIDCEDDPSLIPLFFDFDRDGDLDLFIGTDKGTGGVYRTRLFRNDDGAFTEITDQANAGAYIDCMGMAVGDLNFDGYLDVYMTNLPSGNVLYMNDAGEGFVDATAAAGLESNIFGWATVFADFDNDTHLDTYICNDDHPNPLYRGSAVWPMENVSAECGAALPGTSFSVAVGDVTGDHRLDMLVDDVGTRVKLFVNHTENDNNYVRFRVAGQWPNTFAVGAQLDVRTGDKWQARQIFAGSNYKASNEFVVHVGVGDAEIVDEVLVSWPGTGDSRVLTNVPVNRQWTIHPPERLGDADGNGRFGRADLIAMLAAVTGPGVPIEPGMEIFDMDGDFDIDKDDVALLMQLVSPNGALIFRPRP